MRPLAIATLQLRQGRSILFRSIRRAALVVFGVLPTSASAVEELPVPMPVPVATPAEPDSLLALKVKAALADDAKLAELNLAVSVVDRVAVVGGPVPDAVLIPRVETALKRVPGLAVIKVSCWIAANESSFDQIVADGLFSMSAIPPFAIAPARPPEVARVLKPPVPKPRPLPTLVAAKMTMQPSATAGFLLDPIAPEVSRIGVRPLSPAYATIPPTSVPVVPVAETKGLTAQLSALRLTDPRFERLSVTLKSGTAIVTGGVENPADAWDFAQELRSLPGVTRIVMGEIVR